VTDDNRELDTHYEAILDDEPDIRAPVYVDVVAREHDRRPIVPASLRRGNIGATARRAAGLNLHRAGYHGSRLLVLYVPLALWYSIIGLLRVLGRQIRWWWVMEQHALRQQTATAGDAFTWSKLHSEARTVRLYRGYVLLAELVGAAAATGALLAVHRWWAWTAVAVVVVPLLAHYGRPVDKPIVSPAVVAPRFRTITADVVLRAYYAAQLGRPDKPDQVITFGGRMEREGGGGRVLVDLPFGKTFTDAVNAREAIASGLDVTVNQVFLTRDKTSVRRHLLFVSDIDPLSIPAGRSPLLDGKPRDVWKDLPFGLDERGRKVLLGLLWVSILVGAQPRKGKTFSARLIALYAALDPYVVLCIADGKNSPDWKAFRLVAHRIVMGTVPNPFSADPVDELLAMLREVKRHIEDVNAFLSTLPASECPEGKLTRDISRKYPRARVWLLVMEEFQVYYELDDPDACKEIAGLLSYIIAVGPSAGVSILSSSQKPSGIGKGDIARLFTRYRDNHAVRFALKCGSRQVSEAVLGTEAYGEGYDAASLPVGPEYRGVGYLYGLTDETPTVRTYLATGEDAEAILISARRHRENAGTLTGHAAGSEAAREFRDILRDADSVYYAGEAWVSWPQLAARLAERMPEHYRDATAESVSAKVRALGVSPKKARDKFDGGRSVWGVPREDLAAAIQRRQIGGVR
jgi:hypothetical protein